MGTFCLQPVLSRQTRGGAWWWWSISRVGTCRRWSRTSWKIGGFHGKAGIKLWQNPRPLIMEVGVVKIQKSWRNWCLIKLDNAAYRYGQKWSQSHIHDLLNRQLNWSQWIIFLRFRSCMPSSYSFRLFFRYVYLSLYDMWRHQSCPVDSRSAPTWSSFRASFVLY